MRSSHFVLPSVLVASLLLWSPLAAVAGGRYDAVPTAAVDRLLAKDWQAVMTFCTDAAVPGGSPVVQALKGHAGLALNRNNESLQAFANLASQEARATWSTWTTELLQVKSAGASGGSAMHPVALYLRGDAWARESRWNEAVNCYTAALRQEPAFGLALNARGVALAYLGRYAEAEADLLTGCATVPELADTHASLGTVYLMRGMVEPAQDQFAMAGKLRPGFFLPRLGSVCGAIGTSTTPEGLRAASTELAKLATESPSLGEIVESNLLAITSIAGSHGQAPRAGRAGSYIKGILDAGGIPGDVLKDSPSQETVDLIRNASKNQLQDWGYQDPSKVTIPGIENQDPGGASTAGMSDATRCAGRWSLRTCFGLMQQPMAPQLGSEKTED